MFNIIDKERVMRGNFADEADSFIRFIILHLRLTVGGCVSVGGRGGERGGGGQRSLINTRKSTSYNIKLSIYNDGVRPVEMKRRLEVEEKLVCTVYI